MLKIKLRKTLSIFAVSTALTTISASAWALDATAMIERYAKLSEQQGQVFSYGSIEESGSGFTIKKPTWTLPNAAKIIADVAQFSDVSENADGSALIGRIEVTNITSGSKEITVTFDSATMEGLQVPPPGATDITAQMTYYKSFSTGKGIVSSGPNQVAVIGRSKVELSPYSESAPITMTAEIADVALDLTSSPDPKFMETMSDLGYDGKFTGRMEFAGDWSFETGVVNLTKYDIVVDNVATISIPFTIGGYTKEVMDLVKEQSKNAKNDPKASQAAGLMVLQKLDIRSAEVRIKDDSVTKRALNLASKKMNQPPEAIAAGAPMMIGLGMQRLQMPELTQMISTAVGAFLQNPGTLSVTINPEKPVNLMELVLASQANPQSVVKLLNMKAEAQ